ncbi:EamA family transporter [Vibrio sp. DNB22_10_4]
MSIGLIASVLGALLQAVNYVLTQNLQSKNNLSEFKLLISIHLCSGILALFPLIAFNYIEFVTLDLVTSMLYVNLPYLVAQYFILVAIARSESAIVSPLLALKIPVLAALSAVFFGEDFNLNQIIAITLIILTALSFSFSSGKLDLAPICCVIIACIGFSLSDVAITDFSHQLPPKSSLEKSFATISLNYTFCGLVSLVFLPIFRVRCRDVYHVKWISLVWLGAVIFLVIGFTNSGVVAGNIIQTLRGVFGVAISYLLFKCTFEQAKSIWVKKLAGSIVMVLSVAIFFLPTN